MPQSSPSLQANSASRTPAVPRREALVFLIPLGIHLALRLLALDGWYERVDVEELSFGLLPAHLVEGLAAPLLDYQTMWREGGSLIAAPFSALFFAVLGPSYFALKVGGIAWHGLILLVWTGVARLALGRREAFAFGLIMACAPPFAAHMQLVALVGHPEGNFLSGLGLLALLMLFRASTLRHRTATAFLLGLAITLGASFTYSAAPALGLCLLLALRNPTRLEGSWRHLLVGLGLGALPWLCYFTFRVDLASVVQSSGQDGGLGLLLGTTENSEIYSATSLASRSADLVRHHLFWMWGWMSPDESFRSPVNYALGTAIFSTALAGVWSLRGHRVLRRAGRLPPGLTVQLRPVLIGFCTLYVLAYLGVTLISGLSYGPDTYDGYRYLAPLFPALLLLSTAGLSPGFRSPQQVFRGASSLGAAALCLAFVWGGPGLRGSEGRSPLRALKGYNTHALVRVYGSMMSDEARADALRSAGADRGDLSFAEGLRQAGQPGPIAERAKCPPEPVLCQMYLEGLAKGWVSSESVAPDRGAQLPPLVDSLRALPPALSAAGFRGMGRGVSLNPPGPQWTERIIPSLEALLNTPQELEWLHEGIGLEEPLYRDFHYSRLFGGGQVPHHLAYSRGVGMGFARLIVDPETAPLPLPIPREARESIAASPWGERGVTAWSEGYEAELKRLTDL